MLDPYCEKVLRFYEGDVEKSAPSFWRDAKGYVTWNALLFEGCETEYARSEEGRYLNPAFLQNYEEVIQMTVCLYQMMHTHSSGLHVRRVERISDYKSFVRYGYFQSFLSTSSADFLSSYTDKKGLVFMEIEIPNDIPCIDLSETLSFYLKAEEHEILLPPYLQFESIETVIPQVYQDVRDAEGKPIAVYTKCRCKKMKQFIEEDIAFDAADIDAGVRFYSSLNMHEAVNEADAVRYCHFKKYLKQEIIKRIQ